MPPLRANEPLAPHTTFNIGGAAEWFVTVSEEVHLEEVVSYAKKESLALTILGGGSNVLVADTGVRGVVVKMAIEGIEYQEVTNGVIHVRVGAGVTLDNLVEQTVVRGLWGLENLSHIPGTVGATPIQNVGAYGVEVADCISAVETTHRHSGERRVFQAHECGFGYRHSFFKTSEGSPYIITRVIFALSSTPRPQLTYADLTKWSVGREEVAVADIRAAVIAIRAGKFPDWRSEGTAGSFFKNPTISKAQADLLKEKYPELPMYSTEDGQVKCSLGFILDRVCGLRGCRVGQVRLYEKQALVLVADRGASADAVIKFADDVCQIVKDKTGIVVEWEVTKIF